MGTLEPQSELSADPQSKQDPEPDLEFRIVPLCMPLHVPFVTAHRRVTDAADQLFLFEALGTCGFGSAAPAASSPSVLKHELKSSPFSAESLLSKSSSTTPNKTSGGYTHSRHARRVEWLGESCSKRKCICEMLIIVNFGDLGKSANSRASQYECQSRA